MKHQQTNIIIGHTTESSAKIWLKALNESSNGELILFQQEKEIRKIEVVFDEKKAFTSVIHLDELSESTSYNILLKVNGSEYSGSFSTFPSSKGNSDFSFMFSSCFLNHNLLIRRKERVYDNLSKIMKFTSSSFMLFCGDQIYIDTLNVTTPRKPVYHTYERKYLRNWSLRGAANFYANNSCYMILDDHEIANDFDNSISKLEINKKIGLQVYNDYQHAHNPDTPAEKYYYNYAHGETQFFVMDTRTERNRINGLMLEKEQIEAFFLWLEEHKDRMKIIISSVPFIIQPKHKKEKWSDPAFKAQYHKILNKLIALKDEKILFISGDYHSAVHGKFEATNSEGDSLIWNEFMAGPLNQALVNVAAMFDKTSEITKTGELEQDYKIDYSRMQIECKYTNACNVNVSSDDLNYYIRASWYRVQHESNAELISESKLITINK